VIGSVLTTILSMSWGFRTVQLLAFATYCVAVPALWRLDRRWAESAETIDLGRHPEPPQQEVAHAGSPG
jgi:hypothetical protein